MQHDAIIALLASREDYLSGEAISQAMGVTRAAVWKEITALREEGWPISSVPRRGYRLDGPPEKLSAAYLKARLGPDAPFGQEIRVLETVDSTNSYLKARAAEGAPHGAVVIAEEQTQGRGTRGRSFVSPKGDGLYLSLLLRPREAALHQLLWITGFVAVAVCDGIEDACGVRPQIKWMNDICLGEKKLCGILTELSVLGESGEPDYVIPGIGTNVGQSRETFAAAGLEEIATSLALEGHQVNRNLLALSMLNALDRMYRAFPHGKAEYLDRYRQDCLTLGRQVTYDGPGGLQEARAVEVDDDFQLILETPDRRRFSVSAGTISVRPLSRD